MTHNWFKCYKKRADFEVIKTLIFEIICRLKISLHRLNVSIPVEMQNQNNFWQFTFCYRNRQLRFIEICGIKQLDISISHFIFGIS